MSSESPETMLSVSVSSTAAEQAASAVSMARTYMNAGTPIAATINRNRGGGKRPGTLTFGKG
ncbi:hypothetical protein XFLAVUS301_04630 [Xanthobacter flavus]|uniref:Uncharacterized protein n=1 Tax=Xanthobacter flavus TaxID=281 RepID=A0A9W6FHQ0_XANFL|nr:hypothetical protein XFLAVUS301_04630 [Xanthobacter flavus]